MLGVMATINQELDQDAIELICADYGVEVEEEIRIDVTDLEIYFEESEETKHRLQLNVRRLLQSWVTLTTVKRHYWIRFETRK